MSTVQLLRRWQRLSNLRDRIDAELRAVRNGLLMAGDDPLEREQPSTHTYTEREMKAAHTLHAAGETSAWVRDGERAYQRTKKRNERARKRVGAA